MSDKPHPIKDKVERLFKTRKTYFTDKAIEFCNQHGDVLIIIADPKTDLTIVSYKGKKVAAKLLPQEKTVRAKPRIIKSLLRYSKFENSVNSFLYFIDGAVYNIAKQLRAEEKTKKRKK